MGKIRTNLTMYLSYEGACRKSLKFGGEDSYSISAELQVEFGSDSGALEFKLMVDGKEAGEALIEFD